MWHPLGVVEGGTREGQFGYILKGHHHMSRQLDRLDRIRMTDVQKALAIHI